MARGVKGSGISLVQTPDHPYKGASRWFPTEAAAEAYAERQALIKRAKRAGFGVSPRELEAFKLSEDIRKATIREQKERAKREREERDRIRRENGLHPKAQISRIVAAEKGREQARVYMSKANRDRMSDAERLDYIRELYRQRNTMSQTDLLFRVGQVVGAL